MYFFFNVVWAKLKKVIDVKLPNTHTSTRTLLLVEIICMGILYSLFIVVVYGKGIIGRSWIFPDFNSDVLLRCVQGSGIFGR